MYQNAAVTNYVKTVLLIVLFRSIVHKCIRHVIWLSFYIFNWCFWTFDLDWRNTAPVELNIIYRNSILLELGHIYNLLKFFRTLFQARVFFWRYIPSTHFYDDLYVLNTSNLYSVGTPLIVKYVLKLLDWYFCLPPCPHHHQ